MFSIIVFAFRFLAIWTALSVLLTTGFCVWALAIRKQRRPGQESSRPGDME